MPASASETFQEALDLLAHRHPALSEAHSKTEAAQSRADFADVLPDPTFSVGRFIEPVQTRTGPQETVFKISQKLPWFGVRDSQSRVADATVESQAGFENLLGMALTRELADVFYEYAFLGKSIKLTEENHRLLRDLEPIVETKVAAGDSLNALLRLKVESGKLSDQLKSLQAKRIKLSSQLNALLYEPGEILRPWPKWTVPEKINYRSTNLVNQLEELNPTILTQESRITVAKAREQLVALESSPTFSVGVKYIQLGDPEVNPSTPDAGEDPWSIEAAIHIPLWRGAERARKEKSLRLRQAEESRKEDLLSKVTAELQGRIALHQDALRKLRLYDDELMELARQAVENSRAGYENGDTTVLELIDSERSLLALEIEFWRAAADAQIHNIHILSLTNPGINALLNLKELP